MIYYLADGGGARLTEMKQYLAEEGHWFVSMKSYLAESGGCFHSYSDEISKQLPSILVSFAYVSTNSVLDNLISFYPDIFLDSGAFSAMSLNISINIKDYIKFCHKYSDKLKVYSVLDVIENADKTYQNLRIMESEGLKPLPCFHYGEDMKYLEIYCEEYNYLALGGMVPYVSKPNVLIKWLNKCFIEIMKHKEMKIHGFGIGQNIGLLIRYPFYSVDSTSWLKTAKFGTMSKLRHGKNKSYKPKDKDLVWLRTSKSVDRVLYGVRKAKELEAFVTKLWAKRGVVWND